MKVLVVFAALLLTSFVFGDDDTKPSDVIVLTDATFDTIANSATPSFVEFYAPWCGHCKKLIPAYEELATTLKGTVNVAKLDATVEKASGARFGVRGFPTIKYFADGRVYDYSGARTVDAFVEFSKNYKSANNGPIPAPGTTVEPPKPKPAPEKVEEKKADTPAGPSDVVVLTDAEFDKVIAQGPAFVEFYAPWCGHCKKLIPTWEEFATAQKGKLTVGKLDSTVETATAARFGIRGYPTIKFIADGRVYDYAGPRTTEAFTAFKDTYKTAVNNPVPAPGSTPPPPPPKPAEKKPEEKKPEEKKAEEKKAEPAAPAGPSDVLVLTDATFDEQVKASSPIFVEFYAPWCGHCKKLIPTWEQLATELKGKVAVSKVDATVEKASGARFGVRGYPTVKYIADGKFYDYSGPRTVEAFTEFTKTFASGEGKAIPAAGAAPEVKN